MWFEPFTVPDFVNKLGGLVFPVGYTKPPGAEIGSNLHVLNDHTYCSQIGDAACPDLEPQTDTKWEKKCQKFHEKRIGTRVKDAQRLEVPLVITEFGACLTEQACTQEISQVTALADENLVGWAYWQFKEFQDLTTSAGNKSEGFYNQDDTLQIWKVQALSRTYLPLVAGTILQMRFDTLTGEFRASFNPDSSIE